MNFQSFFFCLKRTREMLEFKENKQLSIVMDCSQVQVLHTGVHTPYYSCLHNACVGQRV